MDTDDEVDLPLPQWCVFHPLNKYLFLEDFRHSGLELEAGDTLVNQTNLVPVPSTNSRQGSDTNDAKEKQPNVEAVVFIFL